MRPIRSGTFVVGFVADGNDLSCNFDPRFCFVDLDLDFSLLLNFAIGLVLISLLFGFKMAEESVDKVFPLMI